MGTMEERDGTVAADTLTLNVKFFGRSIPVAISADSTVKDLKALLHPLTNVLTRGQKLIFKGQILVDNMTLKASELANGSKIMLVASQGVHQGDGPITKVAAGPAPSRRDGQITRGASKPGPSQTVSSFMKLGSVVEGTNASANKSRSERWKATGVVALSHTGLKVIPDDAWAIGTSVRLLDISCNQIRDVPDKIGSLTSAVKLSLHANDIVDESISWESVTSLKSLKYLALSQNHLTMFPSSLGALTSLTQLFVSHNQLTSLPDEIGYLTQLQIFQANHNRLTSLPSSLGNCNSLVQIDLSSNLLSSLPETLANLLNLKDLNLSKNGIKSLPSKLVKMCSKLIVLNLHRTEITLEQLREMEGYEDFDQRRKSRLQRRIDLGLDITDGFDEVADQD